MTGGRRDSESDEEDDLEDEAFEEDDKLIPHAAGTLALV